MHFVQLAIEASYAFCPVKPLKLVSFNDLNQVLAKKLRNFSLVWLFKPIKLVWPYKLVEVIKVGCAVKPFKIGMHFVQLNYF